MGSGAERPPVFCRRSQEREVGSTMTRGRCAAIVLVLIVCRSVEGLSSGGSIVRRGSDVPRGRLVSMSAKKSLASPAETPLLNDEKEEDSTTNGETNRGALDFLLSGNSNSTKPYEVAHLPLNEAATATVLLPTNGSSHSSYGTADTAAVTNGTTHRQPKAGTAAAAEAAAEAVRAQKRSPSNATNATGSVVGSKHRLKPGTKQGALAAAAAARKKKQQQKPSLLPANYTNPNQTVTQADLQYILSQNNFLRSADNLPAAVGKQPKTVALPKPTLTTFRHIQIGTTISTSLLSLLFFTTLFSKSAWLVGLVTGAVYGNNVATRYRLTTNSTGGVEAAFVRSLLLPSGTRIARAYLSIYDLFKTLEFMYKTGQLSYQYYQRYEMLDKRFGITSKMDAWNARFVEGKENFDRWEKENEIGRQVLAGLRTVFMVEEQSTKKGRKRLVPKDQSKYRLVRYASYISYWVRRFFVASKRALTGGSNRELVDLMRGVRMTMRRNFNWEIVSRCAGASIAALVVVNVIGAFFAVAPWLLGFVAITAGIIWPHWVGETYARIRDAIDDMKARGRGESRQRRFPTTLGNDSNDDSSLESSSLGQQNDVWISRAQLANFSYFTKQDGSKHWYRTYKSRFAKLDNDPQHHHNNNNKKKRTNGKDGREKRGFFGLFRSNTDTQRRRLDRRRYNK